MTVIAFVFTACSTIVSPTNDVTITSEPSHIHCELVLEDGNRTIAEGTTPFKREVKNKYSSDIDVVCSDINASEPIETSSNGWVWGNILFGGIIGIIIDVSTGNASEAEDTHVAYHN